MAEERIWIDYPLPKNAGAMESRRCTTMTRQEAIEKMAVGMCRFDCNDIEKECCNCNEWEKYDKLETLAEAALNALLEEK